MMKRLAALFLLFTLMVACAPAGARPATPRDWWRDAVFYEIFVRSFYDSDGNGIGDFNGITAKLDYIQSLGANAIWLMPIHPSSSYHGYDVINYYAVNYDYGSMADFQNLVDEVHKRNMHLVIDLVINHSSTHHPWFVDANNNPASPYRDWYLWSESYPGYNGPFGLVWRRGQSAYFYSIFPGDMADLNYTNPAVTAQMHNVTRFWLEDIGVDGFRIDAIKHLIEEGQKQENTPSTHTWLKDYYTFYKSIQPQAYTVGEVASAGALLAKTYSGDQMDQIFNFELANATLNSVKGEANSSLNSAIKFNLKDLPSGNYATFLTNHDQDRAINFIGLNVDKAKVAAAILLTGQGTPFIYYGEELGMTGRRTSGPNADVPIRAPMQWNANINAGFSTGKPWHKPTEDYIQVNVANEDADPNSLLNYYRALIKIRMAHPALRTGNLTLLNTNNAGLYAILRTEGSEIILVLVNLKGTPISDYGLSSKGAAMPEGPLTSEALTGNVQASALIVSGGDFSAYKPIAELAPYQVLILQLSR
jgi:glycosidase